MNNRKNAYKEVWTILQDLNEEEYDKIPQEVVDVIFENMNKDYYFELDDEIELKDINLLPETKAILFNLFRKYLATDLQKEKIVKMLDEERKKIEGQKRKKYSLDVFYKKS